MQGKVSEKHIKLVLEAWKTAPRVTGLQDQLLAALELYEHFPLDIAVTGGVPETNVDLARAVCGLKDEKQWFIDEEEDEEDEDEDEDEEEDESECSEEEPEQTEMSDVEKGGQENSLEWRTERGLPVVSHPCIPNVRVWILNGHISAFSKTSPSVGSLYDLLVVLTSELQREDHMGFIMELRERDQPLYLVRAEDDTDLVKEELKGPCKTCAWERMRDRRLELQRKRKDREVREVSQDPDSLVAMKEIGGLLLTVLPEMKKNAFCQFILSASQEVSVPKILRDNTKSTILPAMDIGKVRKEDMEKISQFLQSKVLINHPSRLLTVLDAMEDFRLDIGVLGPTGCGSSTFINALMGLKNNDEGAAPTGVTETTLEPVAYQYPLLPNVMLWDLPGIGRVSGLKSSSPLAQSQAVPLTTALHPACDVYILLSPVRLSMDSLRLLHNISASGKDCYMVLSKVDHEEKVGEMRKWCEEVLSRLGYQTNVYLVTALQPERMDFSKLTETLHLSLSGHKKKAMAQFVAKLLEHEVFDKRTEFCKTM